MNAVETRSKASPGAGDSGKPRPRGRLRAKVLLLLASSAFTFLVGEVSLRLAFLTDRVEFETDEELLWRNRPNEVVRLGVAQQGRKSRSITTDERGFRRTLPASPPGGRRVLALGDSAMFGALLDDEETFCSQLQALAGGKLEVINTAVGGWGLFQQEILLRRLIGTIRPEIVLVHYQSCDVRRQPFPPEQPRRRTSFLMESRLRNAIRHYSKLASLIGHLAQVVVLNRAHRGIVNEVVEVEGGASDRPTAAFRNCWEKDRERLIAMKNLADRHGAKLVVVPGGPWDHLLGPQSGDRNISFFFAEMAALSREHAIVQVDMTGLFGHYDFKTLTIPGDGHPSLLWNREVAQEIYRTLVAAAMLEK